jgi:ABC-2 type transport system ATP-binding protein
MGEMALTADHLVVIGRGRLIAENSVAEFVHRSSRVHVRVRSPQADQLSGLLTDQGAVVTHAGDGALQVTGLDIEAVGDLAGGHGLLLHELVLHEPSLEAAYMEMTQDAVDYRAAAPVG